MNKKSIGLVATLTIGVLAVIFLFNFNTVLSILDDGPSLVGAVINSSSIVVNDAKDTAAHPVTPYPYIPVHQHDDLFNGRNIDTGRKDFIPDFDTLSNISINKSMSWTEFLNVYTPSMDDIVKIPSGVTVTYNYRDGAGAGFKGIALDGTLIFDPNMDTKMTVGTIIVGMNGSLIMKPSGDHTQEIVFKGVINKARDPYQTTLGLITLGMSARIDIQGRRVNTPFAKISGTMQGNTLTLESASGLDWRVGDEVFLHGDNKKDVTWPTPSLPYGGSTKLDEMGGFSTVKITGINGNRITVDKSRGELGFEPVNYVTNVTRTVVLRSHPDTDRAHTMFNSDTELTIKYAAFIDLGRTSTEPLVNAKVVSGKIIPGSNQVGRYALHLHHLQSGYDVEGNVIRGERLEEIWQDPAFMAVSKDSNVLVRLLGGERIVVNKNVELKAVKLKNLLIVPKADEVKTHLYANTYSGIDITHGWATDQIKNNFIDYSVDDKGIISANGTRPGYVSKPFVQNGHVMIFDPIKNANVDTGWQVKNVPIASPKWGIVSHNSFGKTLNNVVIGAEGTGIVGEEGLETGTINGNLVVGLGGGNGDGDDTRWWGMGFKKLDLGYGGFGYWFIGGMNDVSNNKADGFFRRAAYGYYIPYDFTASGVVPTAVGNARRTPNISGMPNELKGRLSYANTIWRFDNNESTADIETIRVPLFGYKDGEIGYSLSLQNVSSVTMAPGVQGSTDGYQIINGYKSIKHGIILTDDRELTFRDIDLKGSGNGIGIKNFNSMQVTLQGGNISNFEYGVTKSATLTHVLVQDTILTNNTNNYFDQRNPESKQFVKVQSISEQEKIHKDLEEKARTDAKNKNIKADAIAYVSSFNDVVRFNEYSEKAYGWVALLLDDKSGSIKLNWDIQGNDNKIWNMMLGVKVPSDYAPLQYYPIDRNPKILPLCNFAATLNKGETVIQNCGGFSTKNIDNIRQALSQKKLIIRVFNTIKSGDNVSNYAELKGVFENLSDTPTVKTNTPPTITLTTVDTDLKNLIEKATINLKADASDPDVGGSVTRVEFFDGAKLLTTKTSRPYTYSVTDLKAGIYTFKAVATDNVGSTSESTLTPITVSPVIGEKPPVSSTSAGIKSLTPSSGIAGTKVIATVVNPSKIPLVYDDFLIANFGLPNFTIINNESISFTIPNELKAGRYDLTWFEGGKGTHTLPFTVTTTATTPPPGNAATNRPPTISLAALTDITNLSAGASIVLKATANDPENSIALVSFFDGDKNLFSKITGPYTYTVTGVTAGIHTYKAIVVDNARASNSYAVSNFITVNVKESTARTSGAAPATIVTVPNIAPSASTTLTIGSANLVAPATVTINVQAFDPDGTISKVEYYNGTTLINTQAIGPIYKYTVSGLTAGTYTFKARSMDNKGAYSPFSSKTVVVNAAPVIINTPPTVTLSTPTVTTNLVDSATVVLNAIASDKDGSVARVEFFSNGSTIGKVETAPYNFTTPKLTAGTYTFKARAIDNLGEFTESSLPSITVKAGTTANKPPTVTLSTPTVTTSLVAGSSIDLRAMAGDTDGTVNQVNFYDNGTLFSTVSVGNVNTYGSTNEYKYVKTQLTTGSHVFKARAIDNSGAYTESSLAAITVK